MIGYLILFLIALPIIAYFLFLIKLLWKSYCVSFFIILLLPFFSYKVFQYYWYLKVIPPKIEVIYPISIGDESYFREGCGVAVFKLSESTIKQIKDKGLYFFDGVNQARGYTDDYYYKYDLWKETPVPKSWTSEGSWFMCSVINDNLVGEITRAAVVKGAYYTKKDEGQLVVIPSLGFVIFSFYG